MAEAGWKCKCDTPNQSGDIKCSNCGAKKPNFFTSPIFYAAIGGGILLILMIVIVVNMLGTPEKKYKEALEKAYKDKYLSEEEIISLAKVQKQWDISDAKAEDWKNEVLGKLMPPSKETISSTKPNKDGTDTTQTTTIPEKVPSTTATPPAQIGKGATAPTAQAEIPTEAKLNMQQGINYMRGKDWDNAIKEFTVAIQKHPSYDVAYSNRAVAYMQQKKFNKALDDLKEAEKINPKNPTVHYNFVALYSLQNQLDRALDSLDRCLDLGFNNYDALRTDPDLNNVRKHPEFRKILEKHKVFLK